MTLREGISQAVNDVTIIRKINIGQGPGARYVEVFEFDGDRSKKFVITDEIPIKVQIEDALRMLPEGYEKIQLVQKGILDEHVGWLITRL